LLIAAPPLQNLGSKPMMIHVMRDGQQFGPYTLEDVNTYLAQGTLLPTDQAWYEGAPDWMLITQVPGVLAPGTAPAPVAAAADPMAAANPAVAAAEAAVLSAENQGSKKKKILIIAGSAMGVVGIALVLCFVYPGFLKGDAEDGESYAAVTKILKNSTCYDCHDGSDGSKAEGDFDLADNTSVMEAVIAGDPDGSELVKRISDDSSEDRMPPDGKGDMLSPDDLATIKAWIKAGAKF